MAIRVQLGDGVSASDNESINFSWVMKDGINESKSCSRSYYGGSGFTTQSSFEIDNGDGTKNILYFLHRS